MKKGWNVLFSSSSVVALQGAYMQACLQVAYQMLTVDLQMLMSGY